MKKIDQILQDKLNQRVNKGAYRSLKSYEHLIDYSSNDYLGLAKNQFAEVGKSGSTGSRLISGNYPIIEELELFIADFHGYESSLIFNSGYTANVGLISSVPQRGDTIIYDELIHASIRDGIRLSYADSFSFEHNNLVSLQQKIGLAKGNIFVVVESIYSMDGDSPDLLALSELCKDLKVNLIVDEAHAIGVVGERGEGLVAHLNLQADVFAVVITFGKALGCHGAAILSSKVTSEYLVNFCRSFIYTTAPSEKFCSIIRFQYKELNQKLKENENTLARKKAFIQDLSTKYQLVYGSYGNIVSVLIPGNLEVKKMAKFLEDKGFFVKAILSPTVAKGNERLRICFHTFNNKAYQQHTKQKQSVGTSSTHYD